MPQRSKGLIGTIRQVRSTSYNVARGLGNLQPWIEGNPRQIIKRQVRRYVGHAMARAAFGKEAGFGGFVRDLGIMLLGRTLQGRK
jgi:hypothetical protein